MTNKEKSKKKKIKIKRKSFRFGPVLIVFLLIFGIYNFGQEYFQYVDLKGEVNYYQDKLKSTEADYAAIQGEKSLLYDDSYIEKMARENLGMIKEGETLILPMIQSDALELNKDIDIDNDIH